jgi:hypothetical protein
VLDDTRVPEWKDTVNVPSKSQLKLAIKFDERPGVWMYHCHILDHAEVGMMGHLRLRERGTPIPAESPSHMHHAGHSMAPSGERPSRDPLTGG